MKDGDAQQRNEILRAMDGIFLNAIEGGCGWHIGKYFCSAVLKLLSFSKKNNFILFSSVNQGWKLHIGQSPVSQRGIHLWN